MSRPIHCHSVAGLPSYQLLIIFPGFFGFSAGKQIVVCHCALTIRWTFKATMAVCALVTKKVATICFAKPSAVDSLQASLKRMTAGFFQKNAAKSKLPGPSQCQLHS